MTFAEFTKRVDREHRRIRRKQRLRALGFLLVFMAVLAWIYLVGAHIVRPWLDKLDSMGAEPVASGVVVTVESKDTLWSIASHHYPGKHTGEIVHAIRKLNPGLDPGRLQVGQLVVLPEVM